jgi:hypothetical protein
MGSESMALKQCLEISDPVLECRALSLSGSYPDSFAQKSLKISSIVENVDAASTIEAAALAFLSSRGGILVTS